MRGFSLIELLVAMLVGIVVMGAVFRLLGPSQAIVGPQLESADLQQRARVAVDVMLRDLLMAGADRTDGLTPPFAEITPGILPYRRGALDDDPSRGVFYRPDTLTLLYVASSANPSLLTSHTYYAKPDGAGALQLMHYNGASGDFPVLDDVVHLSFAYFGDPRPPTNVPRPEPAADPDPADEYPAGENCLFMRENDTLVPRLPVLAGGEALVCLDADALTDGPWCPNAFAGNRFDADLLRIRRVRVRVRLQTGVDLFRGPAGPRFSRGGSAGSSLRLVPDMDLQFDVTPRNLNAAR